MSLADLIFSRLYVRGSLRNSPQGISLTLRNSLAPATVTGLTKVEISGRRFAPDEVHIRCGGATITAAQVNEQAPLILGLGMAVDLLIPGASIPPGTHSITIGVITRETGEAAATIADSLYPADLSKAGR